MVSDGLVTFTGLWPGYLAYVQHKSVRPLLTEFNLGSSENPADYHLIIDLVERRAFVAPCKVADRFQATQWKQGVKLEKTRLPFVRRNGGMGRGIGATAIALPQHG